ncbi:hypothetical protein BX070DRAFT_219736, partial [Coemansia spiralis]
PANFLFGTCIYFCKIQHLRYLVESAKHMLPFTKYTLPDGQLNLVSRLPKRYNNFDLGPELDCEHGRPISGSCENMCYEAFNMLNFLMRATKQEEMQQSNGRKSDI